MNPKGPENIEELKQREAEKYNQEERGASGKPHRKHGSNYTPPKKRNRK